MARHKIRGSAAHPLKTTKGRPPRKVLLSPCGTIWQWLRTLRCAPCQKPTRKDGPPAEERKTRMKAYKDLTALDFPGVDPEKFEKWKQASINAEKNTWMMVVITVVIVLLYFVGIYLATGRMPIGGILGAFVPTIFVLISSSAISTIWGGVYRLGKEIGIDRAALKRARSK